MSPTVSVILPAYNRVKALPLAINSILQQSFRDFELIVVDDASTEDVESVVRKIGDPRIRYIKRIVNGGAAAARNSGLAEARGNFFAFQDSDDLWLPGKLERHVMLFERLPSEVGVVCGNLIVYGMDSHYRYGPGLVRYEPSPKWRLSLDGDQQAHLLRRNRISVCASLFRRTSYPDLQWFDERLRANEDWDLAVRLAAQTKIYEDLHPCVLCYRLGDDHISRIEKQKILSLARVMKKNKEAFSRHPKAYGFQQYRLGIGLYRIGKQRAGRRFIVSGLMLDPSQLCVTLRRRLFG